MTVRIVHRPARVTQPLEAPAEIVLAPPPPIGESSTPFPVQSLLPILGSLSSITMIVLLRNNPVMVVVGAVILVVALVGGLGMAFTARGNAARQRRVQRERYLDYLEEQRCDRARARRDAPRTRRSPSIRHPATLVEIGANPARRWERRPGDADFLRVRIGTGDLRAVDVRLPPEQNPVQPFDPVMKGAADPARAARRRRAGPPRGARPRARRPCLDRRTARRHRGPVPRDRRADRRAATRRTTSTWPPSSPPPRAPSGRGSTSCPTRRRRSPPPGQVGRAAHRADAVRPLGPPAPKSCATASPPPPPPGAAAGARSPRASSCSSTRGRMPRPPLPRLDSALDLADLGITVIHVVDDRLKEPSAVSARVTVADGTATDRDAGHRARTPCPASVPTPCPTALLDVIARPLAGLRLTPHERRRRADDARSRRHRTARHRRRRRDRPARGVATAQRPATSCGCRSASTTAARRCSLDLKESAQLGMGPHGICIGATGSGKSELLRTLILGLALTHSPDDLSMILVDYKGGAAFAPFAGLPHVAGHHRQPRRRPAADRARPREHPGRGRATAATAEGGRERGIHRPLPPAAARASGPSGAPAPVPRDRRVRRAAHRRARLRRAAPHDRAHRPVDRRAPAAVEPADRGRSAARPRHVSVVPHRAADLLGVGVGRRARHARRLPPARDPRVRLPQGRHVGLHALPRRLRVGRRARADRGRTWRGPKRRRSWSCRRTIGPRG